MWIMQPFIILRGEKDVVPVEGPADRPFTIAGCIAVWRGLDDPVTPVIRGSFSGQMDFDQRVEVEEDLVHDMLTCPLRMPKPETLFDLLRRNFPDAVAISLIFSTIVVEFE